MSYRYRTNADGAENASLFSASISGEGETTKEAGPTFAGTKAIQDDASREVGWVAGKVVGVGGEGEDVECDVRIRNWI